MDESKAEKAHKLIHALRTSQGILSHEQFVNKVDSGEFEIIKLPNDCYALVQWLETEKGKTLWVHTCAGNVTGSRAALIAIETYAQKNNGRAIAGFARWGWKALLTRLGFNTRTKLTFFEKDI